MKRFRTIIGTAFLIIILSVLPSVSVLAETDPANEPTSAQSTEQTSGNSASSSESGSAQTAEAPSNQVWPKAPEINSESALIMEVSSSIVLYEKDADSKRYPASTTKILTALLAIENCSLDEEVTFSKSAVTLEEAASNIDAVEGEVMPMRDVLYGLMLASGNDCGNAIAEHVAGSVPAFAEMMNARAEEIGCTGTHFTNPHGLFSEEHYTTARDLSLIAQEAFKNTVFVDIISASEYTAEPTNKTPDPRHFDTYDLHKDPESEYYDEDVIGGKTGFLDEAGRCLVTFAERNGFQVILVQLKGGYTEIFNEAITLLNYTFKNFSMQSAASEERRFATPVEDAKIALDPSAQILTLNHISFEQLESKLIFAADMDIERRADLQTKAAEQGGRNIYAVIDYSYAGHELGSANVYQDNSLSIAPTAFTRVYYFSPLYLVIFILVVLILVIFAYAQKNKKPVPVSGRAPAPRRRRPR